MDPEAVRAHLAKVLASEVFQTAGRSGKLLAFLVEHTLDGRTDELKEYTLGAEALGRGPAFDPRTDSIARVEASRLRTKLDLYYATDGHTDPLRIVLPKGGYVPQFKPNIWSTPQTSGGAWRWVAVTLGLALIGMIAWNGRSTPPPATPALHLEVNLGPAVSLQSAQVGSSSVIVSPDGARLVFVSFRGGVPRLMTKLLTEESPAVEIPGTEGARGPFFSPNGEWVSFQAGGKLKKTQLSGGLPVVLCDCLELLGGSWGDDDVIVAHVDTPSLSLIPAAGGQPQPIPALSVFALWPQVLPGAKAILFTAGRPAAEVQTIAVYSHADRHVKTLVNGSYARYLTNGHILYLDRGTAFAAPFDLDRLEITGPRVTLLNGVSYTAGFGNAEFDVSHNGRLVYRRSAGQGRSIMAWIDAAGAATPLLAEPAAYMWPRLSPDGSKVAYVLGDSNEQSLKVFDARGGRGVQVLFGPSVTSAVTWTPDGRFLITTHPQGGLQWASADGAGTPGRIGPVRDVLIPWSLTANGDRLAVYRRGNDTRGSVTFDLWTMPLRISPRGIEAGEPEPFLVSDAFETYPEFSPDGRWIAYTSLEAGSYDVYVRAFPDRGRKWTVSRGGGRHARWLGDGRLFYSSVDHRIMEVRYSLRGDEFVPREPRVWRSQPLADTAIYPDFDITRDGRVLGLLAAPGAEPQDEHHVTVMLNVFDEIARQSKR